MIQLLYYFCIKQDRFCIWEAKARARLQNYFFWNISLAIHKAF